MRTVDLRGAMAGFLDGPSPRDAYQEYLELKDYVVDEFDRLEGAAQDKHLHACVGLSLFKAQVFEAGLHNVVLLEAKAAGRLPTRSDFQSLDSDLTGRTLGNLLSRVSKVVDMPPDVTAILNEARDYRNQLCHGYFYRHSANALSAAGQRRMCEELLDMMHTFVNANVVCSALERGLARLTGMTQEHIEAAVEKLTTTTPN